ncbi:MAG: phosphohydrolase [Desulfurococcales archaeon ex4484_58]|nr:MAG: phosphohydrolase [Desulfurococcales archaeon ex4484_58]
MILVIDPLISAEAGETEKIVRGVEATLLSILPFNGQIRDVIYPYIDYVKGFEDLLIDSWPLQRLRYIYQLQTAHFVYPSATHTRFNHSIGVMHYSYKFLIQLLRNSKESIQSEKYRRELMNHYRELVVATRILGLIHDIGHGPFSHAFDDYVLSKRDVLGYRIGNHEVLGYLIYRDYLRDQIIKVLKEYDRVKIDWEYVVEVLDNGMKPPHGIEPHTDLLNKNILRRDEIFTPLPENAIENIPRLIVRDYIYTSDIIDYLLRDSYFTGLVIGNINEEWIIRHTYLIQYHNLLVPAIASKALDDLVRLLDARIKMYKSVYFHHVNIAFKETIGLLMDCIKEEIAGIIDEMINSPDKLEIYTKLTDHSIYGYLQNLLFKPEEIKCENKELVKQALKSLFIHRKPAWKRIYTYTCNLEKARPLFSQRFGPHFRETVSNVLAREIALELKSKGFSEEDIRVSFNSIEVYPSATRLFFEKHLHSELIILQVREHKPINQKPINLEEFVERQGIFPEALFIIYLNRAKYQDLSEEDITKIRELVDEILGDAIGEKISTGAPETS